MNDEIILVTGATGKTGRRVARLLQERGVRVRTASRSSTPSFDWTDRTTWEPALREVTGMYLVVPDLGSPQAAQAIGAFARQAAAAGAQRAVLLSVPEGGAGRGGNTPLPQNGPWNTPAWTGRCCDRGGSSRTSARTSSTTPY
ncbi:SDR family oxidoreductase [Streptomyces sp. NPDC002776]